MLTQVKIAIVLVLVAVITTTVAWVVYEFHHKPIAILNKTIGHKDDVIAEKNRVIADKDVVIKLYEKEIGKLYEEYYLCEQNSTKNKLEGIIEGLGGEDETNIVIDFSNIQY